MSGFIEDEYMPILWPGNYMPRCTPKRNALETFTEKQVPVCSGHYIKNSLQWKLPKCLWAEKWISKLWYVYRMISRIPIGINKLEFSSVQSLSHIRLCDPMHTRPPCPSPTPGVYPNSCPSSWWYHPTISSSVVLFPSGPQSFQTPGSFPISQFFISGGQSTGVSASTSRQ